MNDKSQFENVMQEYFNKKSTPLSEAKEKLHIKLMAEDKKRKTKQLWFVAIGVAVFAILAFLLTYFLSGPMIALYVSAVNVPFSACGSVILIIASNRERKGGNRNVVLD